MIKKQVLIAGIFFGAALLAFAGGTYAWAQSYQGRIAPNVLIGPLDVSGMDPEVANQELHRLVDAFLLNGIDVRLGQESRAIGLASIGTSDADASANFVSYHTDRALASAMNAHRAGPTWQEPFRLLFSALNPAHISLSGSLDEERFFAAVQEAFPGVEQPVTNAGFIFTEVDDEWKGEVTPARVGRAFESDPFFAKLEGQLAELNAEPVSITLTTIEPEVSEQETSAMLGLAKTVLENAPYTLTYQPDRFTSRSWSVTASELASALQPKKTEGDLHLAISADALSALFDTIALQIDHEATDARFAMENGRVIEFSGSQTGVALDREKTAVTLAEAMKSGSEEKTVAVAVTVVEPSVATADANDLGISEVLGVGTSSYRGSPANRIKNIRNGVKLLNGILIQPEEEFSLLNALKPFTTTNGYFPELVIKGSKLQPEVGGGLCQIGTTTFRATMNSGLPITQRQNHSLVVRYYNDPKNGNPGTDATIYDPAPDFRFVNDTGSAILFEAVMDEANAELAFTFWGTSDGRTGSYSAPELVRWIPAGAPVYTQTTDLEPGETQCQHAFVGADARFTYTIERANGDIEEKIFESHYRPLPEICLVGKIAEETSEETSEEEKAEGAETAERAATEE